jgi:hypothetical protein
MKHIALIACVLAVSLIPTAAFANDKKKDRVRFEQAYAQIIADRLANGYTADGRPIPRCDPPVDNCAPRYDHYYYRHDRGYGRW